MRTQQEGTQAVCPGRTGPGTPWLSGLSKHGVVGGKGPRGPWFQDSRIPCPSSSPFPALVTSWPCLDPQPQSPSLIEKRQVCLPSTGTPQTL